MALPRTETFTLADGVMFLETAPWTAQIAGWSLLPNAGGWAHEINIVTNRAAVTSATVGIWAYDSANTYNNDQYALGVINFSSGTNYIGVSVRNNTSDPMGTASNAAKELYFFEVSPLPDRYFAKKVAGTETQLGDDAGAVTSGDTIRIEASGTTITAKLNGTTIFSVTDTSLTSGAAGFGGESDGTASMFIDNWEGGNLTAASSPFIPVDTPLIAGPSRRVVLLQWTQPLNQTTLAPVVSANPFYQTNWPNPGVRLKPNDLVSFIGPNHQRFAAIDTFFNGPGLAPNYDWPNPRGKAYPISERTFIGPNRQRFFGIDTFFDGPGYAPDYDWPNPRGKPYPTDLRTFIGPNLQRFFSQDVFFDGPGYGPDYDWPNPVIRRRNIEQLQWVQNLLNTTLVVTVAPSPFAQTNWPNPRGAAYPTDLRTSVSYFVIDDNVPFFQTDWPNPTARVGRSIDLYSLFSEISLALSAAPAPFNLLDWPNPGRRNATQYGWSQNLSELPIATAVASPFIPILWDNPSKRGIDINRYTWTQNLAEIPFSLSVPFLSLDWPNPTVRTLRAIELATWLQNLAESTLAPVATPFNTIDWTNPILARYPVHLRGLLLNMPETLVRLFNPAWVKFNHVIFPGAGR